MTCVWMDDMRVDANDMDVDGWTSGWIDGMGHHDHDHNHKGSTNTWVHGMDVGVDGWREGAMGRTNKRMGGMGTDEQDEWAEGIKVVCKEINFAWSVNRELQCAPDTRVWMGTFEVPMGIASLPNSPHTTLCHWHACITCIRLYPNNFVMKPREFRTFFLFSQMENPCSFVEIFQGGFKHATTLTNPTYLIQVVWLVELADLGNAFVLVRLEWPIKHIFLTSFDTNNIGLKQRKGKKHPTPSQLSFWRDILSCNFVLPLTNGDTFVLWNLAFQEYENIRSNWWKDRVADIQGMAWEDWMAHWNNIARV